MSWSTRDIPDLTGRRALVTGVTGGLGYETALALARAGAHVTLTGRAPHKVEAVAETVANAVPGAGLDTVVLDLADLGSIREAAAIVTERTDRLDMLVNNAGVMAAPDRRTVDGFELQFGTNHLGHFALTGLLLPVLGEARVVTVTSIMHRMTRGVPLTDPRTKRSHRRWPAYSESKLANLLFTLELDRRARTARSRLTSVGAHPGYASTELQQSGPQMGGTTLWSRALARLTPLVAQSAHRGALPLLYAATMPDLPGGTLVGPDGPFESRGAPTTVGMSRAARNESAAARLWEISERATGVTFVF